MTDDARSPSFLLRCRSPRRSAGAARRSRCAVAGRQGACGPRSPARPRTSPPGPFRGSISLNGSAAELPVSGDRDARRRALAAPGRRALRGRPGGLGRWLPHRRRSRTACAATSGRRRPREWTGTRSRGRTSRSRRPETRRRFLSLEDVALTEMSPALERGAWRESRDPQSVRVSAADRRDASTCSSPRASEVGERRDAGHDPPCRAEERPRRSRSRSTTRALLSAAGEGAAVRAATSRCGCKGRLVLRLKGGDVVVPLDLSGHLTDAS